jgi:hypothetical protein
MHSNPRQAHVIWLIRSVSLVPQLSDLDSYSTSLTRRPRGTQQVPGSSSPLAHTCRRAAVDLKPPCLQQTVGRQPLRLVPTHEGRMGAPNCPISHRPRFLHPTFRASGTSNWPQDSNIASKVCFLWGKSQLSPECLSTCCAQLASTTRLVDDLSSSSRRWMPTVHPWRRWAVVSLNAGQSWPAVKGYRCRAYDPGKNP